MKHKKTAQKEKVEKCRNAEKNCCRYNDIHENDINENILIDTTKIENDRVKKIYDMMKKFEARIGNLENNS